MNSLRTDLAGSGDCREPTLFNKAMKCVHGLIQPQVEFEINPKFNFGSLHSSNGLSQAIEMRTILGKRINQRLTDLGGRKNGKTQSWIAEKLKLTDEAISKWVIGKSEPELSNLRALAKLLQCSIGYLAGDEPDDDVAAIAEMAYQMPKETRRMYRKSGAGMAEPDDESKKAG